MSQKINLKTNLMDKRILDRLQDGIPLVPNPWKEIADDLNISQKILLKRIAFLKKKGIIRRISATFNPQRLGFVSTLVAVKVSSDNIKRIVNKINRYHDVTHNYKRDSDYNVWFTIVAVNRARIDQIIEKLGEDEGVDKISELPAKKMFKINVNFKLSK